MKKLIILLLFLTYHFVSAQNARFLIPYRESNKWGFCDTLGRVKIAPKYKSVDFFIGNEKTRCPVALAVINDSTYTYIDSSGKSVLPTFTNKKVTVLDIDDKIHFHTEDIKTKKRGLYIDKKLIVEPIFDYINSTLTYNSCIWVKLKNKVGLFNENGEIIIPIQFDKITASYYQTTEQEIVWFGIKGNSKTKFIQKATSNFSYEIFKRECLHSVFKDDNELYKFNKENEEAQKKIKIISLNTPKTTEQKTVVDTIKQLTYYETLLLLKDSLKKTFELDSINLINKYRKFYYVEKSGKQGIIDDSLKLFLMNYLYNIKEIHLNSTESWLYTQNQSLVLFVYEKNGKYGVTNEFDDTILAPIYDKISLDYYLGGYSYSKKNKQGLLLVETYYKPIQAKYASITKETSFVVSYPWVFNIYKVTSSNYEFLGYVGENGIEYFKN